MEGEEPRGRGPPTTLREGETATSRDAGLVVVSSAADGTPQGAEHKQNQTDDDEDDPDRPQNGDLGDEADYEQDDT